MDESKIEAMKSPSSRRVYTGQALRAVAMPMGGIGAGQIALCGDGSLRQWQIFNQVNHQAFVPDTFFAVWAKQGRDKPIYRVLQTSVCYDETDFHPAPHISDHVVPEGARRLLERLPGVDNVEFIGEYPIAYLTYKDADLPVQVSLEAFSPFVPLNPKDSGLPAIVFIFNVKNVSQLPVKASLAASLQNAVGWDGVSPIVGVENTRYGDNRNTVVRLKGLTAIDVGTVRLPRDDAGYGHMTLATLTSGGTYLCQWENLEAFWMDFIADGALANTEDSTPSSPGRTWNGALAVPLTLNPKEEKQAVFVLTWYFPNRYVNWNQTHFGVKDAKSRFWLGNLYNNWFGSSLAVAEYVRDNFDRLVAETRLFHDTFYDSTLPYWLLDCVTSQISIIRSPTCFWTEDGNFYGFEGCSSIGGCCPLNCTHVWNYEQALAKVFPSLERTMRVIDLETQLTPEGGIPHRTVLPLYLPRWHDPAPDSQVYAADGHFGTILKAYREYLQSGDKAFLGKLWPGIKKAMVYALNRWDPDGDGVADGPQWNTYDLNFYGHNTFIGSFYLAALRAAEEMAKIEGETDLAEQYRRRFEKGRSVLEAELWNGEYYVQRYEAERYRDLQYGEGCLSDQVIGQWWAHLLGLGYVLSEDHVKTALRSIYRYNFRPNFVGFKQQPRIFASEQDKGLLVCTWPHGSRPEKPMNYCDEVWTGIEYQVAAHMLYEGMVHEALHLVKGARDRYDGTHRNPWNEVECGDHYARAMSSWSLLEAAAGYHYNAAEGTLSFAPRLTSDNFRAFFITAAGWGTFTQKKVEGQQVETLYLAYGELQLRSIKFRRTNGFDTRICSVTVQVNGKAVEATWQEDEGTIHVTLTSPMKVSAGETAQVTIKE